MNVSENVSESGPIAKTPPTRNVLQGLSLMQSGRPDLNRRPPAPEAGALPGCATPRERRSGGTSARR